MSFHGVRWTNITTLDRSSIFYFVLAAAVLIAFGASVTASFHFDDYALFGDPHVTSPSGWYEVWRLEQTRPLTYFTFWLNHAAGGADPSGYHAFNVLIHLLSVLLLYGTVSKLAPGWPALAGAVFFAIHPVQAEPVIYIYARATLLMTLFCLLSLREWLNGRLWVAVAWFVPAMLAKEECAAFPLFLLLLHFSKSRNRRELPAIGTMLAVAVAIGLRVVYILAQIPDSGAGAGSSITAKNYFLTQGSVIWHYFTLLLFPWGFTVDHDVPIESTGVGLFYWATTVAIAVVAACHFSRARWGFWFLGGLVLLLPSSSVFPANDLMAERRLYLPMIAMGVACVLMFQALASDSDRVGWFLRLASRTGKKGFAALSLVLLLITIGRVQVWQTERSLWAEAVERSPGKLRPRLQLARASEPAAAIQILGDAKTIAPEDPRVASELGRRFVEAGRPAEALAEFGRALALDPGNPMAHNNRGVILLQLGQTEVAKRDFERALELAPCQFDARLNLLRIGVRTKGDGCRYPPEQAAVLSGSE
jgi:protein O-mannosyl-transferase